MKRIAIVGGGPAGFMAAIAAAEGEGRPRGTRGGGRRVDLHVTVLDRGVPLTTLLRTGGGRCNLANATFDRRELADTYPRGSRFLVSAFCRFGSRATMAWFEDHGLKLAVEEDGRVFPSSHRAAEVRDLLLDQAGRLGVEIRSQCEVVRVMRRSGGFQLALRQASGAPTDAVESFDAIILCTGGDTADPAWSGYRMARSLGHATSRLAPSLTALVTAERWPAAVAGLTLPDAALTASFAGKTVADERGSLLFTHRGISGPLAFRISSRCAFLPYDASTPLALTLHLYPEHDLPALERRLDAALARNSRRSVLAALRALVPRTLAPVIADMAEVPAARQGAQASREERRALARALGAVPLTAVAAQEEGEIVTAGGVELHLVDQRTMESRIVPRLYFCGELLDIDGFTGGYNLQAAWTTGRLAGLAVRRHLAGLKVR